MRGRRRGGPLAPSGLAGRRGVLDGLPARVARPGLPDLEAIDAIWPTQRHPSAENRHWVWSAIAAGATDCFALSAADNVLAIWASTAPRPLRLPGGLAYRLDWLEVAPNARGRGLGAVAIAAAAARATELQCTRIVLHAVPGSAPYWAQFGENRLADGWVPRPGLLPFLIEEDMVRELERLFRASFPP